jgi:4-hydroxy-3-polyprenylbenzoate decarboxylase
VPATSEIVIEGTLSATEQTREGPMGEYSGYLSPGGGMASPVFHVSAMTYRNDPILPVVAAGEPIEENHTCWGLAVSAQLLWELRRQGFPVSMCFATFESAAHWLVVTVKSSVVKESSPEMLAADLARTVFRSRAGSFIPKILLMADDVDPSNLDEVVWAFATRCHPQRGQLLFPNERMLPLVAFLTAEERQAAQGTKVIYNCLLPEDCPADQAPRRSSFRHLWPKEIQDKVIENWKRYGYAEEG